MSHSDQFVDAFPEGFFFIRCKATPMALDVNAGGMLNDFNIIIWPQKMVDSINQLWMHEDGFLINRKSGLVLDIRGGDIKHDKAIIQYARKPGLAHNQRWKYQHGFICSAASPDLVLDIRGGDHKEAAQVFLNRKNPASVTQQWLLQPFEDARSKQDLTLLRPPPLQKHLTEFPQPDELCDYHRVVYHDRKPSPSPKEVAGAVAFEAMRIYLAAQKEKHAPAVAPDARDMLNSLVREQFTALQSLVSEQDRAQVLRTAEQAAAGYFAREFEEQ